MNKCMKLAVFLDFSKGKKAVHLSACLSACLPDLQNDS